MSITVIHKSVLVKCFRVTISLDYGICSSVAFNDRQHPYYYDRDSKQHQSRLYAPIVKGGNPVRPEVPHRVFMGYVLLLVLTAFVTYWVWSSGNKVQDAIQLEAGARIEEAKRKTAELEQENLKLRRDFADRRITKEQHDILVDFLSKRRGRIIIETMGNSEAGLFAADILKTFTDSGWEIDGKHFPQCVIWIGLVLYHTTDPDALTVADALKAAGIPYSIGTENREKATIMVGGKPPMF